MGDSMLSRPVGRPPPGVQSNIENPPNCIVGAYLTLAAAITTTSIFAWTRFLVKLLIIKKLHLEDYLIPFAWFAAMGQIGTGFMLNSFAPWIHAWDITLEDFGKYLFWYMINTVCYNIAIVLIKSAILIQILRIFVPHGRQSKTYYIIHGLIWSNLALYVVAIFLRIFTCQPIQRSWKPWLPGKCLKVQYIGMSTQVANLIGDLTILLLTQRIIWNLMRVDRKQRIRLSVVFFAGVIPCGFAIMCLYYSSMMVAAKDFTYNSALMTAACYGEIVSGMFVLFIPILPRFFTHLKTVSTFGSSARRSVPPRAPSPLEFTDTSTRGTKHSKRKDRKQSLWHVSYTQGESAERLSVVPGSEKDDYGEDLGRVILEAPVNMSAQARKDSEASIHLLPIQGTIGQAL